MAERALHRFPAQRFEDVIVACLWAGDDAVASHDTALAVYDLTDAMPAVIHLSTPRPFRGQRRGIVVHTAPLGDGKGTERAGVPVSTVERTIGLRLAEQLSAELFEVGDAGTD